MRVSGRFTKNCTFAAWLTLPQLVALTMDVHLTEAVATHDVIAQMQKLDHEQILFCQDRATGLKAIIAVHNTTLGPSLGGTRMWNYASESEALTDVLRLSRGMTYKSALAGLNLGGGKAVIFSTFCDKSGG
jgi:leucine dehydrogenase